MTKRQLNAIRWNLLASEEHNNTVKQTECWTEEIQCLLSFIRVIRTCVYGVTSTQAPLRLGLSRVVDKKEPAQGHVVRVCVCVCVRGMQKLNNDYQTWLQRDYKEMFKYMDNWTRLEQGHKETNTWKRLHKLCTKVEYIKCVQRSNYSSHRFQGWCSVKTLFKIWNRVTWL